MTASCDTRLVYYPDSRPGITRVRRGRGFSYLAPDGTTIACADERARLASLAVPPAYRNVWICPLPNGHLQATGLDDRDRKQYRYHPLWSEFRARLKFDQLPAFARTLPRIRRRLTRDLEADPGTQLFALAALVSLIDRTGIRVGNRDYLEENGSYGATTLKRRHLRLLPDRIVLKYKAKGGARVQQTLRNPRLHRVLGEIDDLPGADLFTWLDAEGSPHPLRSDTVNEYLGEISGEAHTAKTFRTWLGTLRAFQTAEAAGDGRLTVKAMATAAADQLGNTPTIARNSYIHPDVIALAEQSAEERQEKLARAAGLRITGLSGRESALCTFLEEAGGQRPSVLAGAEPEPGDSRFIEDFDQSRP
jgi:DNA topoisomerase I